MAAYKYSIPVYVCKPLVVCKGSDGSVGAKTFVDNYALVNNLVTCRSRTGEKSMALSELN